VKKKIEKYRTLMRKAFAMGDKKLGYIYLDLVYYYKEKLV
jgi:hypothetical protein